jgi:hypothetical protein
MTMTSGLRSWRSNREGRELLRRYLIADQAHRDALALRLLHEGTEHAAWLADLIDTVTMHPNERRRVVRLLGELEAREAAFGE